MAKYLYVKYNQKGLETNWANRLYSNHLKVWNNYHEDEPVKNGLQDYLSHFHELIKGIKKEGFSPQKSLVGIDGKGDLINGSHRLGSCLFFGSTICYYVDPKLQAPLGSAQHLKSLKRFSTIGMEEKYLDAMAVAYSEIKKDTYIATIFPTAKEKKNKILTILENYCEVIYAKTIPMKNNAGWFLMRELYEGESWLGSPSNQYEGASEKAKRCFPKSTCGCSKMIVYLFSCSSLDKVKKCKREIRELFSNGNDSIHINDTHEETKRLARLLFNQNGVHFLNTALPRHFLNFEKFLASYKRRLFSSEVDPENFCIDGSAVLSLYGIRECHDLDFLHHGAEKISEPSKGISSHNSHAHYYESSIDEIIFNPENHFYYSGVKFTSLKALENMKKKRGEVKDQRDLLLIEKFFQKKKEKQKRKEISR